MNNYIRCELLKNKKSFSKILLWITPMVCIAIAYRMMGSFYVQVLAYNWWYLLFLPFVLAYVSSSMVGREKKHNYHGLFGIASDKSKIWYAKIGVATWYLIVTSVIFCMITLILGIVFEQQIPVVNNIEATFILIATFAWEIPLFMLVARKTNLFVSIVIGVVGNMVIACACALENYWWIPFAIPARLMCYVLHLLPNGLLIDPNYLPESNGKIGIGLLISFSLFIILSVVTGKLFKRQEV